MQRRPLVNKLSNIDLFWRFILKSQEKTYPNIIDTKYASIDILVIQWPRLSVDLLFDVR
jgi:hypothetical protein